MVVVADGDTVSSIAQDGLNVGSSFVQMFKKTAFIEVCNICPQQSCLHAHGLPAVRSNMFTMIIHLIGLGMASGHLSYVAIKMSSDSDISDSLIVNCSANLIRAPTFQDA